VKPHAPVAPRLITAPEAAGYFGLSVKAFERLNVARVCFGARVLYDRHALDAYLDGISGLDSRGRPLPDDDPEAALARFTADLEDAARRSPHS
jgi:hypothetical protein